MIDKYLGKTVAEIKEMAETWKNWKRVYTWEKKPRKTEKDIAEFYQNMPVEYICDLELNMFKNCDGYISQLGDVSGKKVLDFGCGTGELGMRLQEKGAKVIFTDVKSPATEYMFWKAKERKMEIDFRENIKDETDFDIIVCLDVLEHIRKSESVFKMLHSKLKEQGQMLLTTPLLEGMKKEPKFNPTGFADAEHIQEAIDDWYKNKTNDFIQDNYTINGDVYTKTHYKFLLLYRYHPHTTGRYLEPAFKRNTKCITSNELKLYPQGEGIKTVCNNLGITHILQIDSGVRWVIPKGLNSRIKTMAYDIDTFVKTDLKKKFMEQYDYKFYAQKRFASGKREYWLPLGADCSIYKPLRTKRKYDMAFCGSIMIDKLHEKRNNYLKELIKNVNIYIGKDSNEFANLRYNEAHFVFNQGVCNDLNMRVFEGMATGSVLLTDEVDDMKEFFKESVHYIGYNSLEELQKKFEEYATKPDEVLKIGETAVAEIQAKHTYDHRVKQLLTIV